MPLRSHLFILNLMKSFIYTFVLGIETSIKVFVLNTFLCQTKRSSPVATQLLIRTRQFYKVAPAGNAQNEPVTCPAAPCTRSPMPKAAYVNCLPF